MGDDHTLCPAHRRRESIAPALAGKGEQLHMQSVPKCKRPRAANSGARATDDRGAVSNRILSIPNPEIPVKPKLGQKPDTLHTLGFQVDLLLADLRRQRDTLDAALAVLDAAAGGVR